MTPLEIEILLHYYTRRGDYRNGDFSAPAVAEAISGFRRAGALQPEKDWQDTSVRGLELGERGYVFCEYLRCLMLPEPRWMMVPPPTFRVTGERA